MSKPKPVIGITMGDPASIGPEIAVKALSEKSVYDSCNPVIIGDAGFVELIVKQLNLNLRVNAVSNVNDSMFKHGIADVYDLANLEINSLRIGEVSKLAGDASFKYVKKVIELALESRLDATVTGPINKESINLAGHKFSGHTEIYAHFTNTKKYAMLLVEGNFRVIHVSTHVSLRRACELVKKERIVEVTELISDACKNFGIENPRIAVAGLNPHSGDGGLFGNEEEFEIIPAIKEARSRGVVAEGPIPADTMFTKVSSGFYDGCVAMYHDQGHIPFKLKGFQWDSEKQQMKSVSGVNITLGLPIIRTSVDHGTALEIAGKGVASHQAMLLAIEYAVKMSKNINIKISGIQ